MLQVLRLRATAMDAIRRFFRQRGFLEVETPSIVPSPGMDIHLAALEVHTPSGRSVGWLATSPEYQMKRLLCAGAERIFQLCRSFRSDERGVHHEREFAMLEWYRANATSDEIMRDTETLVGQVARSVGAGDGPELAPPWGQMTVVEAFERYASVLPDAHDEERFFRIWVEAVQPSLGHDRPVFVTHWPASMASLARLNPDGTADRFEAFWRGVELCNGFGELTDAAEQRRRFERDQAIRRRRNLPVYPVDERFLTALEGGMPQSGGNALGVDRLLMLLTGAESIQAVMPFPEERL